MRTTLEIIGLLVVFAIAWQIIDAILTYCYHVDVTKPLGQAFLVLWWFASLIVCWVQRNRIIEHNEESVGAE